MNYLKKIIAIIILLGVSIAIYIYRDAISKFLIRKFIASREMVIYSPNNYYRQYDFMYVKETENFYPQNKEELMNVFYTILNRGWSNFNFYCGEEYDDCKEDIRNITYNNGILSYLNNFVHPYNSYKKIYIEMSSIGKVSVSLDKLYNIEDINLINGQMAKFIEENITDDMSDRDKILKYHDFIANITIYDNEESKKIASHKTEDLKSYKASNIFKNGLGLCGGYTDVMAIYLDKLGIKNYRISNENHIWNYIYLVDGWYHLDLTWDDPVTSDGSNIILYDFFLINTDELKALDTNQHNFNENVYLEVK